MSTHLIRHEHGVLLDAAPKVVWQLASNISRYPEWVGVTLAVLEPHPEMSRGAVYRERTRIMGPVTTVASWTVADWDDAALFQRHECADHAGPVTGMWIEMRVSKKHPTRFTVAIGCEIAAGVLTGPLARLMSRRLGTENARNVERFAALVLDGGAQVRRVERGGCRRT
jgi:hypothetical protein